MDLSSPRPPVGLGCCQFYGGGSVVVYYCLIYFLLFVLVLCLSLFWYELLCVLSSFAIILKRKRGLVALLLISHGCPDTVDVLWLFLTVSWVGLQCVIVVFPDHTHFFGWLVYGKLPSQQLHVNGHINLTTLFPRQA